MKKKIDTDIYFTPKQAAEYFNLSLSTIKNYIYAGRLKTLRTPGGHHRIRKSELLTTLGEKIMPKEEDARVFGLRDSLCTALLGAFKALGPIGNSLTMHAKKVSDLSSDIARAMGMKDSDIKRIEMAGLLHDIGLIGVEKYILLKSDNLTLQEYESVKNHPKRGEEVLSSVKELKDIADIVEQHHERIDGSGYPKGLRAREIQKLARIISIAEAYDSMVASYSYKSPISKEKAIKELLENQGSQFDGEIVKLFVEII